MYKYTIYIFGPDITNKSPDDIIDVKIGMYKNDSDNLDQRFQEHKRHRPSDISLKTYESNITDGVVHNYIRNKHFTLFMSYKGAGHEVITLKVSQFLILEPLINKFINGKNTGNCKTNTFSMRKEQEEIVQKTISFFSDINNKGIDYLWDCKMRFGKTFAAYQLVLKLNYKNVLILTQRPTDTKNAWFKDIDHVDFNFNFVDCADISCQLMFDQNRANIIFCSFQNLDFDKWKLSNLWTTHFDIIIIDEDHHGGDTDRSNYMISNISHNHILRLSGTPFKELLSGNYTDENKSSWSYIDEQKVRKQELKELGQLEAEKTGKYYWLCPMEIRTIKLSEQMYKDAEAFSDEEGFTFIKLFAVDYTDNKLQFKNNVAVEKFIDMLRCGDMPFSVQAPFNLKHTFWYLPGVKECKLFADYLRKHPYFSSFEIIVAAGDNENEGKDTANIVKQTIANCEDGLKKLKTITLSCGKLTHGVSIPEWDAVFLLSDVKSPELFFQTIFRCQTERPSKRDGIGKILKEGKHKCYVFDFNPNRTLEHIETLSLKSNNPNSISAIKDLLDVFNVLCYEENKWNEITPEDVIGKFKFGRSMVLPKNILNIVDIPLTDELKDIIDNIIVTSSFIDPKIEISKSDISNGKNYTGGGSSNCNASDGNQVKKRLTQKEYLEKITEAKEKFPLLIKLFPGDNIDDLLLNINCTICKSITGITLQYFKKIFSNTNVETKKIISNRIYSFRRLINKEQEEFMFLIEEN